MWFHVKNYGLQQLFIALFSEILLTYSYLHHLGISLGNAELGAQCIALHISGEEKGQVQTRVPLLRFTPFFPFWTIYLFTLTFTFFG